MSGKPTPAGMAVCTVGAILCWLTMGLLGMAWSSVFYCSDLLTEWVPVLQGSSKLLMES